MDQRIIDAAIRQWRAHTSSCMHQSQRRTLWTRIESVTCFGERNRIDY